MRQFALLLSVLLRLKLPFLNKLCLDFREPCKDLTHLKHQLLQLALCYFAILLHLLGFPLDKQEVLLLKFFQQFALCNLHLEQLLEFELGVCLNALGSFSRLERRQNSNFALRLC